MSKAILEFDAPKSCRDCLLRWQDDEQSFPDKCDANMDIETEHYTSTRHPNCPLKIVEILNSTTIDGVETRLILPQEMIFDDDLQWIKKYCLNVPHYECPECDYHLSLHCIKASDTRYCPSCGVKLLPPIEGDK